MISKHLKLDPKILVPASGNPQKMTPEMFRALKAALAADVDTIDEPAVWEDAAGRYRIISGHHRIKASIELGWNKVSVKVFSGPECNEAWYRKRVVSVNKTHGDPEADAIKAFLAESIELGSAELPDFDFQNYMVDSGYTSAEIDAIINGQPPAQQLGGLAERFLVPPFSVLDARQGYWQDRKRAWLAMGIKSEVGRGNNLLHFSDNVQRFVSSERDPNINKAASFRDQDKLDAMRKPQHSAIPGGGTGPNSAYAFKTADGYATGEAAQAEGTGTSIFDPVLCELAYLWFSPKAGACLDPFAGGSVRGVVAGKLGRSYLGIDLRDEQVQANRAQAKVVCPNALVSWAQGDSAKVLDSVNPGYDFILSCPPYADLEVYSNDPADISNMPYDRFLEAYREIIAKACSKLKQHRFACWVVGEVREKDAAGFYRNFVADTISAFSAAGLGFYNEMILVTSVGSLPLRSGKIFSATRKVGKTHQQVLVFCKGDPRLATEACGPVDISIDPAISDDAQYESV